MRQCVVPSSPAPAGFVKLLPAGLACDCGVACLGNFVHFPPQHARSAAARGGIVTLYSFFRSSAAYRVRIALNLKGLSYDQVPIHLQKDGGRNKTPEYRAINPHMRVPALVVDGGEILTQSMAICEYLDEVHPQPPLLPAAPIERARARALAQLIACDIHPLNNTGTLRYLKNQLSHDQSAIDAWYHHWVLAGFQGLEALLNPGLYSMGEQVTLADICLVPQVYNARRLKVPLDAFPKILAVDAACNKLAEFDQARPEKQPDAE
jgi:maleylpyruvate isomerase